MVRMAIAPSWKVSANYGFSCLFTPVIQTVQSAKMDSDLVQITGICRTSSRKHLAKCLCSSIRQPIISSGNGPEASLTRSSSYSGRLSAHLEVKGEHSLRSESLPGLRSGCVFNLSVELQS